MQEQTPTVVNPALYPDANIWIEMMGGMDRKPFLLGSSLARLGQHLLSPTEVS